MIQVHKDALGNITGYFDTERSQWVPPPPTDMEAEVEDDGQAADEDDAGEPTNLNKLTKDELKEILDSQGATYRSSLSKDELIALVEDLNLDNGE